VNKDQFFSTLRMIGQWAAALLVAKGIGDGAMWDAVIGAGLAVGSYVWSLRVHA